MYKQLLILTPLVTASAVLLIEYLIGKYETKRRKKSLSKLLLFGSELCNYHSNTQGSKCTEPRCVYNNMLLMKSCIAEAKHTLEVCLYLITVKDMAMEIVRAHRRGVRVRLIVDAAMAMSNGSKFETLRRSGIRFRLRSTSYFMHCKFVIIDDELLLNGSLNWTMQAIFGNWDHVLITSHKGAVKEFKEMFNFVWEFLDEELKSK